MSAMAALGNANAAHPGAQVARRRYERSAKSSLDAPQNNGAIRRPPRGSTSGSTSDLLISSETGGGKSGSGGGLRPKSAEPMSSLYEVMSPNKDWTDDVRLAKLKVDWKSDDVSS